MGHVRDARNRSVLATRCCSGRGPTQELGVGCGVNRQAPTCDQAPRLLAGTQINAGQPNGL
jgi:hypothetical protein